MNRAREIQGIISDWFEISEKAITGPGRQETVIWPRFAAMFLIRKHTTLSTVRIGELFGYRDHKCVFNALDRVKDRIKTEPLFAEELARLEQAISIGRSVELA